MTPQPPDLPPSRDWDAAATRLGRRAVADGEPTRWFEELWSAAGRDEIDLPWDRSEPYPPLVEHLRRRAPTPGQQAVVVGTGLGADAELLATAGLATTAFDISGSAIRAALDRHPGSRVSYRVANLLDPPPELLERFDLVVEIFTVQALSRSVRDRATAGVRRLLAPGGEALVVQFVRPEGCSPDDGPPYLLDRADMEAFASDEVRLVSLDVRPHPLRPDGPPIWVAVLRRDG